MKEFTEGYRILEHPSDMGIETRGATLKEAFEYAATGLISIIIDPASVDAYENRNVRLTAMDKESLLVKWLSEILYLFDGQDFLVAHTEIELLTDIELEAVVSGEPVDNRKHQFKMDVKAVTYHQLKVEESIDRCSTRVFLDI
ncbi:MAG: archease [bacterium]